MATKKVTPVTKKTETAKKTAAEPVKPAANAKATSVEKVAPTAPAVKAEPEKKPVAVKVNTPAEEKVTVTAKKTPEKKTPEKKAVEATKTTAPAKKAPAKKEIKVKAVVEHDGKQVEEKEMIARVKKAWTKSGRKVSDIKSVDLYIKPQESAVYYVINGVDTGAVEF